MWAKAKGALIRCPFFYSSFKAKATIRIITFNMKTTISRLVGDIGMTFDHVRFYFWVSFKHIYQALDATVWDCCT